MVAIHVMPALLLQKPSKKSKDHTKALERRLKLWDEGKIDYLFHEGRTIQDNLKMYEFTSDIGRLSKKSLFLVSRKKILVLRKIFLKTSKV